MAIFKDPVMDATFKASIRQYLSQPYARTTQNIEQLTTWVYENCESCYKEGFKKGAMYGEDAEQTFDDPVKDV